MLHVNYGLRGEESDADEQAVKEFCDERHLAYKSVFRDAQEYAEHHGVSIQMAARTLRYDAFAAKARQLSCNYVAVGHHADDQAETVLLNLGRGSGPEGLAGMPVSRSLGSATLVRPLLHLQRSELLSYAQDEGLNWREDSSNTCSKYRRSAIRLDVLPIMENVFGPGVISNIATSGNLMRKYVDSAFQPALAKAFEKVAGDRVLDLSVLVKYPPIWQRRLILEGLRKWLPGSPASMVEAVFALINAQPGKRTEWGGKIVWRGRNSFIFDHKAVHSNAEEHLLHLFDTVFIDGKRIGAELLPSPPINLNAESPKIAYLDASTVNFPVRVRRWRDGDRMIPLGMTRSKKISDILTDARVEVNRRKRTHVLVSEEEIVWLAGYRIAHPYRVRSESREVAKLVVA